MPVLDSFRLNGKVALVTGGARGLGETMAIALAEAGADVALDRTLARGCEAAAKEIADATGRKVRAVCRRRHRRRRRRRGSHAEVTAACGSIDILDQQRRHQHPRHARSAVGSRLGHGHRHQPQGAVPLSRRRFGPQMVEARMGTRHQPRLDPVGDRDAGPRARTPRRKPASLGLTRVLALEWAGNGVTCNAICPGPFATDMNRQLLNDPVSLSAVHQPDSDRPLGRARRDGGRRRCSSLRTPRRS